MRKFACLLLVCFSASVYAQSIDIPPQQCVWRAGDNPAWAAPSLDEAEWQPMSSINLAGLAHLWVRCRLPLQNLHGVSDPAVAIYTWGAYEAFLNGILAGKNGNLRTGHYSNDTYRIVPVPSSAPAPAILALRVTHRPVVDRTGNVLGLSLGSAGTLRGDRAESILQSIRPELGFVILYSIIGVIGIVQLGLFWQDRTRLDLLWLSLYCMMVAMLRVNQLATSALVDYPARIHTALFLIGNFGFVFELLFFFAVARKRVPRTVWVLYGVSQAMDFVLLLQTVVPPELAQRMQPFYLWSRHIGLVAWTLLTLVPFVAFWPWKRIPARLRPIAFCCFLWALTDFVYFALQTVVLDWLRQDANYQRESVATFEARAVISGITVLLILALLFRDQRRITEERAQLAGEMASAREIQQYLIPDKLPPTPGLNIRSVYHPSREVGGDFFQVLPDPRDGSTLLVLGDVAGKGLRAGMLAALIVGAIRTAFKFTSDPARILALLNERLQDRGLVTCLTIRIDRDGNAELANAGHLPPYVDGKELTLDGALPLGALLDISFPTLRFRLQPGQSMLFVSDGVVEAQSPTSELFGFDRTREISTQSAEAIASAAQQFGQEDDITVLTLTFAPAEVLHA